jgi:hypothetical protein
MSHRLGRSLPAGIIVSLLVAGCVTPGQGIVDRIRAANSPIVREIVLTPPNPFGGKGDEIHIYVVDEATEAEALALWCDVVLPAGAAQLPFMAVRVYWGERSTPTDALDNPICPDDGSPPRVGIDLSSLTVTQSAVRPSSTGTLGSVVFSIATVENESRARTARVSLRVVGTGADSMVTLTRPVQWIRPAEVGNVEAVWVALAGVKPGDVRVEVADIQWYAVQDAAWYTSGLDAGDVTCTNGSADEPPECSATNRFAVPLNVVQDVTITPEPVTIEGYAASSWLSPHPTTIDPGQTMALDIEGLEAWWKASVKKMPEGFVWSSGGSLAEDQPGFGTALP